MHPPASTRCQIYGESCVRCINTGTHWVTWAKFVINGVGSETEFHSWECDGPHLYGEADTASLYCEREAA